MLLWVEPWDQYGASGGTPASVATFGYTETGLSGTNGTPRTGGAAAWIFNSGFTRAALNTPVDVLGQGAAWFMNGAAGNASSAPGFRFDSAGKVFELSCTAMPDMSVGIWDRTGTLLGKTIPNLLINGSYVWVEVKVTKNTAGVNTGQAIVKVNGQLALTVNGVNLPNQFAYFAVGSQNGNFYLDDWIVWDNSGAHNNDFMGDRRLFVSYPNANAATQDFTPTPAGNAWDRLNDAPPNDAAYIEGAAVGNVSEFVKQAVGIASTDIAAAVVIGRLFKSDAGVASGRIGINSVGNVINSAEFFPGTTGAYTRLIQELDPNGNIAWTRANFDAANIRVTRAS